MIIISKFSNSSSSFISITGQALLDFGESLRQMAEVKYSLDDNAKQNFLEPLHHLQMKDLKEVMVSGNLYCLH
jgi:hypothetical protein